MTCKGNILSGYCVMHDVMPSAAMRENSSLVFPLALVMSSNLALFATQVTYNFHAVIVNLTTTGLFLTVVQVANFMVVTPFGKE